jgi:hypothetical protein
MGATPTVTTSEVQERVCASELGTLAEDIDGMMHQGRVSLDAVLEVEAVSAVVDNATPDKLTFLLQFACCICQAVLNVFSGMVWAS